LEMSFESLNEGRALGPVAFVWDLHIQYDFEASGGRADYTLRASKRGTLHAEIDRCTYSVSENGIAWENRECVFAYACARSIYTSE
jgi:hypothetical protein